MLCVVKDITSVSIGGLEYKAEDGFIEIPDEAYKKLVNHPDIRPATSKEIAELEKIAADRKAAAEETQAQPAATETAAMPPEEAKAKGGGKSGSK